MMAYKLEIACFNEASALIAQQGGANRVELCREKPTEGLTPFVATVKSVRNQLHIDLNIMIRPRDGNFVYTDEEVQQILDDIKTFKALGVNGFVIGILNAGNTVNIAQNKKLVEAAHPLPCTFHRAFDVVDDMYKALEDCIACGFKAILTSAGEKAAIEGLRTLDRLVKQAGERISILPGGGIRSANIGELKDSLKVPYYHSSAITDGGEVADVDEVKALKAALA